MITIDYAKALPSVQGTQNESVNIINGNQNVASTVFAALISKCIAIYVYQFMLGGSYTLNTEDKLAIGDNLQNIKNILAKYQEPDC